MRCKHILHIGNFSEISYVIHFSIYLLCGESKLQLLKYCRYFSVSQYIPWTLDTILRMTCMQPRICRCVCAKRLQLLQLQRKTVTTITITTVTAAAAAPASAICFVFVNIFLALNFWHDLHAAILRTFRCGSAQAYIHIYLNILIYYIFKNAGLIRCVENKKVIFILRQLKMYICTYIKLGI